MAEFFSHENFKRDIPEDAGEQLVEWIKWVMDILEKQQQQIYMQGLRIRDLECEDSQ